MHFFDVISHALTCIDNLHNRSEANNITCRPHLNLLCDIRASNMHQLRAKLDSPYLNCYQFLPEASRI